MKTNILKKTAAAFAAVIALTLPISGCSILKDSINDEINSARSEISSGMSEARAEIASGLAEAKSEIFSAMDEVRDEVSSAVDEADTAVSSALDDVHIDVSEAFDGLQDSLLGDAATEPPESSGAETASGITTDDNTDTTTVPEEGTVWYTFRTQKLFDDHYKKHGAEFGDITQDEYLALANELINDTSDNILHKREKEDNDFLYFDTTNDHFLVLSTDGYIRTFFIPNAGIKYWERQ